MLWTGSPIGAIQRLSAASFVAAGHPVRFYTYDEPHDLPSGVESVDAASIMPQAEFHAIRSGRNPSWSTAANGFRLRTARALEVGAEVALRFAKEAPVKAVIQWVSGKEAGGVFVESIAL